ERARVQAGGAGKSRLDKLDREGQEGGVLGRCRREARGGEEQEGEDAVSHEGRRGQTAEAGRYGSGGGRAITEPSPPDLAPAACFTRSMVRVCTGPAASRR